MSLRIGVVAWAVLMAGASHAAFVTTVAPVGGAPLVQTHLGERISIVATGERRICVATTGLDLDRSRYVGPDREVVDPDAVRRSRAAHVAVIDRGAGPETLRISFKYPVDFARPAYLTDGDRVIDLTPRLDAAGDLATVDDRAHVEAMLDAVKPWRLVAHSADTGRRVTDAVDPPSRAALAACAASLATAEQGEPSEGGGAAEDPGQVALLAEPVTAGEPAAEADPAEDALAREAPASLAFDGAAIGLTLVDPGHDAPAVTAEEARVCGLVDEPRPLQRAALTANRGFFSQIGHALIARGPDGAIDRIYVQGVFDARRRRGDVWRAAVSRGADAFDPSAEAVVSGCIGAAEHRLCARETPEGLALDACFGDLLSGDPFGTGAEDFGAPLSPPLVPAAFTTSSPGGAFALPSRFGAPAPFAASSPGGSSRAGAPGGDAVSDAPKVVPTPLPAGAWLLLSAAGALGACAHLRRRRAV